MDSLPTPRDIVTNLINSISTTLPTSEENPLLHPSPSAKNLLLTLHVLFPTEFLPALDLLDRNLITRLVLHDGTAATAAGTNAQQSVSQPELSPPIYFARSAQQASSNSRYRDALATQYYEVRTRSWNCSCPAFAFSAFPSVFEEELMYHESNAPRGEDGKEWTFGGMSHGKAVPVCKHLLACVLIERVNALKGRVVVSEVSKEELAGWAAGWTGQGL
jgi:hypothetical protein